MYSNYNDIKIYRIEKKMKKVVGFRYTSNLFLGDLSVELGVK